MAALEDLRKLLAQVPAVETTPLPAAQTDPGTRFSAHLSQQLQRPLIAFGKYGTISGFFSPRATLSVPGAVESTEFLQAAELFLAAYPGLLHLGEDDSLVQPAVALHPKGGATVRFRQNHAGIPCHGTHVTVLLNENRRLRGFFSSTFPVTASAIPSVDQQTASALAADANDNVMQPGELLYVDRASGDGPLLVWKIRLETPDGPVDALVDAHSGERVERLAKTDAAAHDRELFDMQSPAHQVRGDYVEPVDYYCWYCTPPNHPVCAPACAGMTEVEQAAWDAMEEVSNFLWDSFGFVSYDNKWEDPSPMVTRLDPAVPNGRWDRINEEVLLHKGAGQTTFSPPYTAAAFKEIAAHEWGHAVANVIQFDSSGEPGTLSEGFADCFALMVYPDNWVVADGWPGLGRDALWPMFTGAYRNCTVDDPHTYAYIVSHTCFAASVADASAVPDQCNSAGDCPINLPPFFDCMNSKCTVWSNLVPVHYQGREDGYAPIFKLVADVPGYQLLASNTGFEDLLWILTTAGCLYDVEKGGLPCERFGSTMLASAMAAGLYTPPAPLTHPQGDGFINTDKRPAMLQNAKPTPGENHLATFYREGRTGLNKGRVYYLYEAPDGTTSAPIATTFFSQQGLSVVPSPPGLGGDLALVSVNTNRFIQYATGVKGSSYITWSPLVTSGALTDQTPSAAAYNSNQVSIAYKATGAGSQALKVLSPGAASDITIPWGVASSSAPAAVEAAGRFWVFYRNTNDLISYTSSTNPTSASSRVWAQPRVLSEVATDAAPEVLRYQMYEGALGEPAVFWIYVRQKAPGTAALPQGTTVLSVPPDASGVLSLRSVMHLSPARVGPAAYPHIFYSAGQWGNMLRVLMPYQYGATADDIFALWGMARTGDG